MRNKAKLADLASTILSDAAAIQQDVKHATDEDDLIDLMAFIEIATRNLARLKGCIDATLEERAYKEGDER